HDTSFVRRAAAEALQGLADPRAVQPLLAALEDPDSTVRVSAIHALTKDTSELVTGKLARLLRASDACVRMAAAQVLSKRDGAARGGWSGWTAIGQRGRGRSGRGGAWRRC